MPQFMSKYPVRFFISKDGRGHVILPKEATQYLRAFGFPEKAAMTLFLDLAKRMVISRSVAQDDEGNVYRPEWKPGERNSQSCVKSEKEE